MSLDEDGDALAPDEEAPLSQVGEIAVRAPALMREYWNAPEQTDAAIRDGWYYTGDLGYADADGYVRVKDRADSMIISGGENIYPREIEDVLLEHSDVVDVAVVGKPDEEWGEKVVAYVVGEDEATEETLDAFMRESNNLADFKRPREYVHVDELPKTPSGKVQKFELR